MNFFLNPFKNAVTLQLQNSSIFSVNFIDLFDCKLGRNLDRLFGVKMSLKSNVSEQSSQAFGA